MANKSLSFFEQIRQHQTNLWNDYITNWRKPSKFLTIDKLKFSFKIIIP